MEEKAGLFHVCLNGHTGNIEGQSWITPEQASRHNAAWKALGDPRQWIEEAEVFPLIVFKADSWVALQASKALCRTLLTACHSEIAYCSAPFPPEIEDDTDERRAAWERKQAAQRAIVQLEAVQVALKQEEARY